MDGAAGRLVGRDAEVEAISQWLRADVPAAPMLLVEGVPGIGKTSVIAGAIAEAGALPMRVLVARPAEPEADLAHAGLIDLLSPVADEVLPRLPAPQRSALDVALLRRQAEPDPPDRLAVGVATANALAALAEPHPVLVVVDDAQWLDQATAEVLRFVARRSRDGGVRVLAARRPGAPPAAGLGGDAASGARVTLGPLSLGAIHAIVAERIGLTLDRPRLRRLHELSGGNAFYAIELARGIRAGTFGLEEGDPLPPDLGSLVASRLEPLSPETRWLLAAIAAASAPTLRLVRDLNGAADITGALDAARDADVIAPGLGAGGELAFTHPLLASATLASIDPGERRQLHLALARSASDPVERARHLALGSVGPDETVATILEGAAIDAFLRGAPSVAADLAANARRFSDATDEPAIERRALAEAEYRFDAGAPLAAAALLDDLIEREPGGPHQARLLARRARVAHFADDVAGGVALLERALAEAGPDRALRGEIEEGLAWGLLLARADLRDALRHASNAVRHASTDAARAEALAAKALSRFALGLPSEAPMREALSLERATLSLRVLRHPSFARAYQLACRDELDAARAMLHDLRARAETRGDESAMATILNHLASVETLAARYPDATAHAMEAAGLAHASGQRPARAAALGRLAIIEATVGAIPDARDHARQALELIADRPTDDVDARLALARGGEAAMWAMGTLSLVTGDAAAAVKHLRPMADALVSAGVREPGELRFLLDEVEALLATGDLDAARSRTVTLEEIAASSRRPAARVVADIAGGQVASASVPEAGIERLEAAVRIAATVPTPILRGRALLALGRTMRRSKRRGAARAALTEAIDHLGGIGATSWVLVARAELARIGGRTSSGLALTPTEAAVADLVSTGMSNREVAAALFVSPKAIEANLARIFAKRGVRSRTELARLMAAEPAGPDAKT